MLNTQVEYWKNVETAKHNRISESQRDTELGILQQNADINAFNARVNATNAETNRLNYGVNMQNAETNRLNYGVNAQNARTNAYNAGVNAYNASINDYRAQTERVKELGVQSLNDLSAGTVPAGSMLESSMMTAEAKQWEAQAREYEVYTQNEAKLEMAKEQLEAQIDLWATQANLNDAQRQKFLTDVERFIIESKYLDKQAKANLWNTRLSSWSYLGRGLKDLTFGLNNIEDIINKAKKDVGGNQSEQEQFWKQAEQIFK